MLDDSSLFVSKIVSTKLQKYFVVTSQARLCRAGADCSRPITRED